MTDKMTVDDLVFEIDCLEAECHDNMIDLRRVQSEISGIKEELEEIREIAEEAFELASSQ